jgi:methylated-DNA-protein-cysteine methyltransferase-like protein
MCAMEAGQFSRQVLQVVRRIPRGRVATYGEVAAAAGNPLAARAVATALRLAGAGGIPWHRVLASGGRIALRGEAALEQRLRLEAEGVRFRGARVESACLFRFGNRRLSRDSTSV